MQPIKLDPTKLDPEVKWRSALGLLLNFIKRTHLVIKEKLDKQVALEFHDYLVDNFWTEQSEAFADLFDLESPSVINAHSLKRIYAAIMDIEYKTIKETEDEVIDEMEYQTCPFRNSLEPVFEVVCTACERIGKLFVARISPNISHEVVIHGDICRHITRKVK
ncbi:MAG: hypothetical protein ACTSQI_11530 [Candidatus Helarchaeota archaeon]